MLRVATIALTFLLRLRLLANDFPRYSERGESYASKFTQTGTVKVIGAEVEGRNRSNMNKEGEQMEADDVGDKRGTEKKKRKEVEGGE